MRITILPTSKASSQQESSPKHTGELNQNATQQNRFDLTTRFPGRLWQCYGHPLKIWLLARLMDDVVKGGQSAGSGVATISVEAAAIILDRSEKTIYRWLKKAKQKGLIRNYHLRQDGWVRIFYTSLEKVARAAEITDLGGVAEIGIGHLKYIHIIATELEVEEVQDKSFHAALKASESVQEDHPKKSNALPIHPERLMQPTCGLARVIGVGQRVMCVSEGFAVYGGSQEAIAKNRGVSVRTIQRHVSNRYRLELTAGTGRRRIDYPIIKKQIARRLPRSFSPISHPKAGIDQGRFLLIEGRWFELGCNVYYPLHWRVKARFRRQRLISLIDGKKGARGGLDPYKGS